MSDTAGCDTASLISRSCRYSAQLQRAATLIGRWRHASEHVGRQLGQLGLTCATRLVSSSRMAQMAWAPLTEQGGRWWNLMCKAGKGRKDPRVQQRMSPSVPARVDGKRHRVLASAITCCCLYGAEAAALAGGQLRLLLAELGDELAHGDVRDKGELRAA